MHGKSDAEVLGVRPALEHANVTLLTNAKAVKLETNEAGTAVTEVVVERDGEQEQVRGRPRRRLAAARRTRPACCSRRRTTSIRTGWPTAPTRSGATTCSTTSQAVLALSREENPTVFQKTLGLNDFYFGGDDFDYPLGNIQMVGKSQAPMFRGEKPGETKLAPQWTLERVARHAVDFWLSTEDLPRPENRVTLDRDGNVTLAYTPNNEEPKERLHAKLKSMLGQLDMDPDHLFHRFAYMKNEIPVAGVRPPGGHVPVRDRPDDVRPQRRLPGARARQPLRRRHELLPEHRRRQPGADGDGQRAPRRRSPAGAAGMIR